VIPGIASLVFIPLLAISMAHYMWAFGSRWPVRDEETLVRTVIGFHGATRMPNRFVTFIVATAILAAGVWALAMTDPSDSLILTTGGALLALVFLGRGIAGFTPKWRALVPQEPFATFDKKLYSPLCLAIGAGFVLLVVWRLS
jgi:Protein of unknown function (DUF3995)